MILELLIGTIATTAPAAHPPIPVRPAPPIATVIVPPAPHGRLVCRAEFGTSSLVRRERICHTAAEWRLIDARRRLRRHRGD